MSKGKNELKTYKADWRIIAVMVVVVTVFAYLAYRILSYMGNYNSDKYEKVVSSYFQAIAKNDTNTLSTIVSTNFVNELSFLKLKPNLYLLYSYHFETTKETNQTNVVLSAKILFSISTIEENKKVSYLAEGYFISEQSEKILLDKVKKIYEGKNITR
jgi:hypothetical protein